MAAIGIDDEYRKRTGGTLYVVEDHRFYLNEVRGDTVLRVKSSVLDHDAKRIHLMQNLYAGGNDAPVATCESMQVHVVQEPSPKVSAMPEAIIARLVGLTAKFENNRAGPIGIRR